MISMTGYGYSERVDDRFSAAVEVKSYNNRYLDINCSMPGYLSSLENQIRERVGGACRRGRVEVYIRFRDNEEDTTVSVDPGVAKGYLRAFAELQQLASINEPVRLEQLLACEGVLKSERVVDADAAWLVVGPLLEAALADFEQSRKLEGGRLANDISLQLDKIERCVDAFESHAAEIEKTIHQGLRARFAEVFGNDVDESRVLAEVAVQLTRFSINEEIVRLRAHLQSFRETAFGPAGRPVSETSGAGESSASDEPVGKKLDFLCQELNREINTTGSKSTIVEINRQVVEAKDALENVREQLRNVE